MNRFRRRPLENNPPLGFDEKFFEQSIGPLNFEDLQFSEHVPFENTSKLDSLPNYGEPLEQRVDSIAKMEKSNFDLFDGYYRDPVPEQGNNSYFTFQSNSSPATEPVGVGELKELDGAVNLDNVGFERMGWSDANRTLGESGFCSYPISLNSQTQPSLASQPCNGAVELNQTEYREGHYSDPTWTGASAFYDALLHNQSTANSKPGLSRFRRSTSDVRTHGANSTERMVMIS